ncbi:MAG: glycosyltransferase family 1 protein [Nitrospiraceae bacterium]
MRIGIDASSIVGDKGGVGWHTHHLLQNLLLLPDELRYIGYVRPGVLRDGRPAGWASSDKIEWMEVPRWLMRWRGAWDRLDLYHGPNFKMHTTGRCGGVVTIHDLWLVRHPEYSPKVFGQAASTQRARDTARRARAVVTVSEFSAREIEALYGVSRERIVVIHNGVSEDFAPVRDEALCADVRRRLELPQAGFLLFVGGADPRKNHRGFLQAVARCRDKLKGRAVVLVGDPEHAMGSYRKTANEFGLESLVCCPGRMNRDDLRVLYTLADVFVFPSLYEGFGMPVLEAMACRATMRLRQPRCRKWRETPRGDGRPGRPRAMRQAIVAVLADEELRDDYAPTRGRTPHAFTWHDAAVRTSALYRTLCS